MRWPVAQQSARQVGVFVSELRLDPAVPFSDNPILHAAHVNVEMNVSWCSGRDVRDRKWGLRVGL